MVMKSQAHLIYKSEFTCFPTKIPVFFYGLPNGKVLVLFAQNNTEYAYDSTLKWHVCEHSDFSYVCETGQILTEGSQEVDIDEFMNLVDNLEQRIIVLATFGNFSTPMEAMKYFNNNVENMLLSLNVARSELCYF